MDAILTIMTSALYWITKTDDQSDVLILVCSVNTLPILMVQYQTLAILKQIIRL